LRSYRAHARHTMPMGRSIDVSSVHVPSIHDASARATPSAGSFRAAFPLSPSLSLSLSLSPTLPLADGESGAAG
jgi:hypothetical protein